MYITKGRNKHKRRQPEWREKQPHLKGSGRPNGPAFEGGALCRYKKYMKNIPEGVMKYSVKYWHGRTQHGWGNINIPWCIKGIYLKFSTTEKREPLRQGT